MGKSVQYRAIVIGASSGGLRALSMLFSSLPAQYPLPLIIVQHRAKTEDQLLEEVLQHKSSLAIKQADEKERIAPGVAYFAPPNYHLMIEETETFSLSSDEPVQYSRPSIDVLFQSAAELYKSALIGLLLTGANDDGSEGIRQINRRGGLTIVQDPADAEYDVMPRAAIRTREVKRILTLKEIIHFLQSLR
jgi:two-component system chemotaxis response regulator CheB